MNEMVWTDSPALIPALWVRDLPLEHKNIVSGPVADSPIMAGIIPDRSRARYRDGPGGSSRKGRLNSEEAAVPVPICCKENGVA